MSKCVLAYHWSFVLYDVILIKHYKLLLYTTLDINGIHFILLDNIIFRRVWYDAMQSRLKLDIPLKTSNM